MQRRQFLGLSSLGIGAIALGGCGLFSEPSRLKVWWASGRLPKSLTRTFARQTPLEIKAFRSAPALWQAWQNATPTEKPHLVSLSDGWLDRAMAANLLQPLPDVPPLPLPWPDLGRRRGWPYGCPWHWGTWVIAYRRDRVDAPPKTWADLLHPRFRQKMVLPASPPLALAIALKQRGKTYGEVSATLAADLQTLKGQILTWDSNASLKIVLQGDAQIAIVGSTEAAAAARDYPQQLAIAEPDPPLLWAETWMQTQAHPAIGDWLRFCQSPAVQKALTQRLGVQAMTTTPAPTSDWLKPLLPDTARRYQAAWATL